jgi:hypothetical protein
MKSIVHLSYCILFASIMCGLQGCVSVRHDRFVRTDDGLRSENAEIYVIASGNREKLRNNPFVVWTREAAPYTISVYVYVFDPVYDGMSVSSANVWVDSKEITILNTEDCFAHTVGEVIPFEKSYDFRVQERHPNAPIYVGYCRFVVDDKLPYKKETNIEVRATVVLWSGGEQQESFVVSSKIKTILETKLKYAPISVMTVTCDGAK